MDKEQIIKALKCCVKVGGYRDAQICNDCPLSEKRCAILLPENALALINSQEQRIKELTEENERLRDTAYRLECEVHRERADTVKKMQFEINKTLSELCKGDVSEISRRIDQIAKEMLEGEK